MAVYAMQPAGSRTRPASREARCRVAVKPRPTGMSHEQPRALRARSGVKEHCSLTGGEGEEEVVAAAVAVYVQ